MHLRSLAAAGTPLVAQPSAAPKFGSSLHLCMAKLKFAPARRKANSQRQQLAEISQLLSRATIKNIVFDLDGVLLKTSKHKACGEIGWGPCLRHVLATGRAPSMHRFFQAIEAIPGSHAAEVRAYNRGMLLPPVLVDWQGGRSSNASLLAKVATHLQGCEISREERRFYELVAAFIFTPERLVATRAVKRSGYELLAALHARGTHKLYILSNWDRESCSHLTKAFPQIFGRVDGTLFSGEVHTIKPSPLIYRTFLAHFDLQASECLFIDDELENTKGAIASGMHALSDDYLRALQAYLTSAEASEDHAPLA